MSSTSLHNPVMACAAGSRCLLALDVRRTPLRARAQCALCAPGINQSPVEFPHEEATHWWM